MPPRQLFPEHRFVANQLLSPLARVTFLLRMAPDRVGPRAFRGWVVTLRAACVDTIHRCDRYLEESE